MDLIAFGTVFLEVVFGDVPALPGTGRGDLRRRSSPSPCGGGAVTVATAASRLGVQAGMSTLLGDDLGSRVVDAALPPGRRGHDHRRAYAAERAAGVSVAVNFAGDRAFISHLPPARPVSARTPGTGCEVLRDHRPRLVLPARRARRRAVRSRRPGRSGCRSPWPSALNDDRRAIHGRVMDLRRARPTSSCPTERAAAADRGRLARRGHRRGARVVPVPGREAGRRRRHRGRPGGHARGHRRASARSACGTGPGRATPSPAR